MEIVKTKSGDFLLVGHKDRPLRKELSAFKNKKGKGIIHTSSGHENVPSRWCESFGLTQEWLPNYSVNSVVDLGILFTLLASRTQALETGKPLSHKFCFRVGNEIENKFALVIGAEGKIGSRLCEKLEGLGLIVMRHDLNRKTYLESLLFEHLGKADFVYLCVNGEDNEGFFGLKYFKLMKKQPVLINLVRKTLVSQNTLVRALNKELISGYFVDDYLEHRFESESRIFMTNHVGARTVQAKKRKKVYLEKLLKSKNLK
tara:strand:+ start:11501 stop:12277 length:777 start_codon:yes stop_codon:yes gene_type:complete